jgi:hypothetical protein
MLVTPHFLRNGMNFLAAAINSCVLLIYRLCL